MTFKEWWETESELDDDTTAEDLAKAAWNAAIDAADSAIDCADYNADASGVTANASAMTAVENLKAV